MKVTLERKEENIATINVETDPGRGKDAYKKTAREFAKHINVPGFRKGKAPIKMIEDQVGVDRIKSETLNSLLAEILYEAFDKEGLEVLTISTVDKADFPDPEEAINIEATLELVPEMKLGKYEGLKVDVEVPKYEEEEYIEQTLGRIASQFADYKESDAAAEINDELTIDFAGRIKESGEELDSLKAEGFQTILDPARFVSNFVEQIAGMKTGDEKDIEVTFPAEYHEAKLQNEQVIFKIKVHKVAKPEKPEFNDDFAKKLQTESMDDLKKRIVEEMNNIQEHNQQAASAEILMKELVDSTEVEIPKAMLDREVESMMHQYKHQLESQGQKWDDVKDTVDMDQEKETALFRIKRSMILSAVIKKEKLEADQEDMNKAIQALAAQGQQVTDPNMMNNLRLDVLTGKAVDFIRDKAEINYKYLTEAEFQAKQEKEAKAETKTSKKKTTKKTETKTETKADAKAEPKAKKAAAKKPAAKKKTAK